MCTSSLVVVVFCLFFKSVALTIAEVCGHRLWKWMFTLFMQIFLLSLQIKDRRGSMTVDSFLSNIEPPSYIVLKGLNQTCLQPRCSRRGFDSTLQKKAFFLSFFFFVLIWYLTTCQLRWLCLSERNTVYQITHWNADLLFMTRITSRRKRIF